MYNQLQQLEVINMSNVSIENEQARLWNSLDDERISRIAGDEANSQSLQQNVSALLSNESRLSTEVVQREEGDLRNINSLTELAKALSDYRIKTDLEINNEKIVREQLGIDLNNAITSYTSLFDHKFYLVYQHINEYNSSYENKLSLFDERIKKYEEMLQDITTDSIQITMDNGEINMGAWTILSQAREWDLEILRTLKGYKADTDNAIDEALEDLQNKLPIEQDIIDKAIEQLSNAPVIKELDEKLTNMDSAVVDLYEKQAEEARTRAYELLQMSQSLVDQLDDEVKKLKEEVIQVNLDNIDALAREAKIRADQLSEMALDIQAEALNRTEEIKALGDTLKNDLDTKVSEINTVIEGLNNYIESLEGDITSTSTALNNHVAELTESIQTETANRVAEIKTLKDGVTTELTQIKTDNASTLSALNNYKTSNDSALANVQSKVTLLVSDTESLASTVDALDVRLTTNETETVTAKSIAADSLSKATTALSQNSAMASRLNTVEASIEDINTDLGSKVTTTAFNELKTQVSNVDGKVTSNTSDITAIKSNVSNLQSGTAANTSAISELKSTQEVQAGKITQLVSDTTDLSTGLTTVSDGLKTKVDNTAFNTLNSKVEQQGSNITSNSNDITRLTNNLSTLSDTVETKADSSALSALTNTVTTQGNTITSHSTDITNLKNNVTSISDAVKTKADQTALNSLQNTVTAQGDTVTAQGNSITSLQGSLTNLTDVVNTKASNSAVSSLDTRLKSAEGNITNQASELSSLSTSLSNYMAGVSTKNRWRLASYAKTMPSSAAVPTLADLATLQLKNTTEVSDSDSINLNAFGTYNVMHLRGYFFTPTAFTWKPNFSVDDSLRVYINGTQFVEKLGSGSTGIQSYSFEADVNYYIDLIVYNHSGGSTVGFGTGNKLSATVGQLYATTADSMQTTAASSAVSNLNAITTQQGNTLTSQSQQITNLNNSLVTSNASTNSSLNYLNARVQNQGRLTTPAVFEPKAFTTGGVMGADAPEIPAASIVNDADGYGFINSANAQYLKPRAYITRKPNRTYRVWAKIKVNYTGVISFYLMMLNKNLASSNLVSGNVSVTANTAYQTISIDLQDVGSNIDVNPYLNCQIVVAGATTTNTRVNELWVEDVTEATALEAVNNAQQLQITATSNALTNLDSKVTQQGSTLTSQSSQLTLLENALTNLSVGGTNLWATSDVNKGFYVDGSGNNISANEVHNVRKTLVEVPTNKSNLIYQVWNPNKTSAGNYQNRVAFYTADSVFISTYTLPVLSGATYQTVNIPVPPTAKFAKISALLGSSSTGKIDASIKVKYEFGTKATDWSPAPEDVSVQITANATAISNLDNKVTKQGSDITSQSNQMFSLQNNLDVSLLAVNSDNVNTFYQNTAPTIFGPKRNLLNSNSSGRSSTWYSDNTNKTSSVDYAVKAPDGTSGVRKFTATAATMVRIGNIDGSTPNKQFVISCWVRAVTGTVNAVLDYTDNADTKAVTLTTEWKRIYHTGSSTSAMRFLDINISKDDSIYVYGAQIEEGSMPTAYQEVVSLTNYSGSGLPVGSIWYKTNDNNKAYRYDGTNWVEVSDSRITANASAISGLNSSVTTIGNTVTSQGTQLVSLQNDLSNINVGARNLAIGTSNVDKAVLNSITNYEKYYDVTGSFKPNEPITVSFEVSDLQGQGKLSVLLMGAYNNTDRFTLASTTISAGKCIFTVTPAHTVYGTPLRLRFVNEDKTADSSFKILSVKLERGNKATDWTPAIEEVQNQLTANANAISTLQNTVTQQGTNIVSQSNQITDLQNSVTSLTGTVNTKASSAALSSLESRVTNTESGLGTQSQQITSLSNSLSGLRVGAVNLLATSKLTTGYVDAPTGNDGVNTTHVRFKQAEPLGERRTVVYSAALPDTGIIFKVYRFEGDTYLGNFTLTRNVPYTFPANVTKFKIEIAGISGNVKNIEAKKIKLEYGTISTDWSPAPDDVQSQITANSTALTSLDSKVTQQGSDITSQSNQLTSLKNTVSNLTVGARNLVVATKAASKSPSNISISYDKSTHEITAVKKTTANAQHAVIPLSTNLSASVTITFKVKASIADSNFALATYNNKNGAGYVTFFQGVVGTEYTSVSFYMPNPSTSVDSLFITTSSLDQGVIYTIKEIQIEEGNIATGWNPAPEDIDEQFTANSSAIAGLDSKITQQGSDISNQSNQITALNNSLNTLTGTVNNKADSSAVTGLTSRVGTVEGNIVVQSAQITNLNSALSNIMGGLGSSNAWRLATYAKTYSSSAAVPTLADMQGWTPKLTTEVSDLDSINLTAYGTYTVSHLRACIAVATAFTWTPTFYVDDSFKLYVDGVQVAERLGTGSLTSSYDFTVGTHYVDILVYNHGGSGSIGFGGGKALSKQANVYMNATSAESMLMTVANSAITNLTSTTTQQGNTLTTQSNQITSLQNSVSTLSNSLSSKADVSALNTLSGRVTKTEDTLTSQSSSITKLDASIKASNATSGDYIPNPTFDPRYDQMGYTVIPSTDAEVPAGCPFPYVAKLTQRDHSPSMDAIAWKEGDVYEISALVASSVNSTAGFNLYIYRMTSPTSGVAALANGGNQQPTQTWTRKTWKFKVQASWLLSGGTKYSFFRPFLQINQSAPFGSVWYATDWHVKNITAANEALEKADITATALSGLDTKVTQQGNTLTSQSDQITNLQNSLTNVQGTLNTKADSTALSNLTSRVTTAEGNVTTQSGLISGLQNSLNNLSVGSTNLWAVSKAVTGYLTTDGTGIGGTTGTANHKTMTTFIPNTRGDKYLTYQVWNPDLVSSGNSNRIGFYDANGAVVGVVTVPTLNATKYQKRTFDIPANAVSLRIGVVVGSSAVNPNIKIKVEFGNTGTDWTTADEDIQSQFTASASALSTLDNKVTQQGNTITSQSNQITSLQNSITTINGNLSNKADASALNTLTSKVNTIEGNVTTASTSITKLQASLNDISVGGTNLLTNTKSVGNSGTYLGFGYKRSTRAAGATAYVDSYTAQLTNLAAGTYILSYYARANKTQAIANFFYDPNNTVSGESSTGQTSNGSDGNTTVTVGTEWKRYWVKWTISSDVSTKRVTVARLNEVDSLERWVEIAALKLEKGSLATDWSPAPSDISIDTSQFATANALSTLDAKVTSVDGRVTSQATSLTNLESKVTNNTATLQTQGTVVNGLAASYVVKTDVNGLITSYGVYNSNGVGAFGVNADYFYVGKGTTATNGKKPFMVLTSSQTINGVTYPAGTWMDVAMIANATIGSAHIANASITTAKIQDAAITDAKIFNLNAGKINAGTLDAERIAASSITADKLSAAAIDAISVKAREWTVVAANGTVVKQQGSLYEVRNSSGNLLVRMGEW